MAKIHVEDWGTGYWDCYADGSAYRPGVNHLAGMVGFIKELVDECGMGDITHASHGNKAIPPRGPILSRLEIAPGHVFIFK